MNRWICMVLLVCAFIPVPGFTQEGRKIRISNANLSFTALPLVARANGSSSTSKVSTSK